MTQISTILSNLPWIGGPGRLDPARSQVLDSVGTQDREGQVPGYQVVSVIPYINRHNTIARALPGIFCNMLYVRELGTGGPMPPIRGWRPGGGGARVPTHVQIFSSIVDQLVPRKFLWGDFYTVST